MQKSILIMLTLLLAAGIAMTAGDHQYAGTKKCKMCHKGEAKGMIFEKWETGPHARAYTVLGEQHAKDVYTKLGREGNPQEDPACLKCHVTGYGIDTLLTSNLAKDEGITCEACHGAGGDYWKKTVMENRDMAIENGMTADAKAVCIGCHNAESPTYKEFKFEEYWAKITHSRPKTEG